MKPNVLSEEPNLQSQAALHLLHRRLLRHVVYRGYQGWLRFRLETLERWQAEQGVLSCAYCGLHPLKIEAPNNERFCATLDHVVPLARGGAKWDLNNLVVACTRCNGKKSDKPAEVFKSLLN